MDNGNEMSKRKFEEYRSALQAEGNRLVNVITLYRHVYELMTGWLDELNMAPAFFQVTIRALLTEIVLWSDKLFRQGSSEFSIWKYINFIEQNIDQIFNGRVSRSLILEDKQKINSMSPVIGNIREKRDKYYAHFDLEYLNDLPQLDKNAPILWSDLDQITKVIDEILNRYSAAYDETSFHLISSNIKDVDSLLSFIRWYKKIPLEIRQKYI